MKVLVDSCIWSLALRRKVEHNSILIDELHELIKEVRVQIIGAIRQEVLSGIKSNEQFNLVKTNLSAFSNLDLLETDYELAAEYFNLLRRKGIQGSNTDVLICAVSTNYQLPIFTSDNDFELFQQHIPIQLHKIRDINASRNTSKIRARNA